MWKFIKSGVDGNCILFGINIFDYEWENTGQRVEVIDPLYSQKHILEIYNAKINSENVTFAAGEFSNGVYGFYIRDSFQ